MDNNEIDQLLTDENEHLNKLHQIVKDTIKEEELIIHNLLNPPLETLTQGQNISDKVARFGVDSDAIQRWSLKITAQLAELSNYQMR